jgi:hypothetical protein
MKRFPTSVDGLTNAEGAPNFEEQEEEESVLMRMVNALNGQA